MPGWFKFPSGQYVDHLQLQQSHHYAWLSDLIEASGQTGQPFRLRKILIKELIEHPYETKHDSRSWKLPPDLAKLCADSELDLDVRLRRLKDSGD